MMWVEKMGMDWIIYGSKNAKELVAQDSTIVGQPHNLSMLHRCLSDQLYTYPNCKT